MMKSPIGASLNIFGQNENVTYASTLIGDFSKSQLTGKSFMKIPFVAHFNDDQYQHDENQGSEFAVEMELIGPLLLLKSMKSKKCEILLFTPNYMPMKQKTKGLWLVPLPDIIDDIIKFTFRTEETRDNWYNSIYNSKYSIQRPLLNVTPQVEISGDRILIIEPDKIEILTLRGEKIDEYPYNNNFIMCSQFNKNNYQQDPYSMMLSTSRSKMSTVYFKDLDSVLAIYCAMYYYSQSTFNTKFTYPPIYIRHTRFEGITTDMNLDCISSINPPMVSESSTKSTYITSCKSFIPAIATSQIQFFDLTKEIHRTILMCDYGFHQNNLYLTNTKIFTQNQTLIPKIETFSDFKHSITDGLEKQCLFEENTWYFNDTPDASQSSNIIQIEPRDFLNLDEQRYSDAIEIMNTIDYKFESVDKDQFEILFKDLENCINKFKESRNSDDYYNMLHKIGSIITSGTHEEIFQEALHQFMSYTSLYSIYVTDEDNDFEKLIITLLNRLIFNKKLSSFLVSLDASDSFTKIIETSFSLFTDITFIPRFIKIISTIDEIQKFPALKLPNTILPFESFQDFQFGRTVYEIVKKIDLNYLDNDKSEDTKYEYVKLISIICEFLNKKLLKKDNKNNILSYLLAAESSIIPIPQFDFLIQECAKTNQMEDEIENIKLATIIDAGFRNQNLNYWLLCISKFSRLNNLHHLSAPIYDYHQLCQVSCNITKIFHCIGVFENLNISNYSHLF